MRLGLRSFLCGFLALIVSSSVYGVTDLSALDRGHRLLIEKGYQLHAPAFLGNRVTHPSPTDPVNLSVWQAANFNGIHFGSANWDAVMWTPPTGNYNWSRWLTTPMAASNPSGAGLVMASSTDELALSDPAVRAQYAAWLAQMRATRPNVISHTTQPGDLIVGYFKPLLEDFDGPDYIEQLYFMITNGLTDSTGNKFDTRQFVRLDFNMGASGIDSLLRLDRDTGQVMVTPLVHDGGSLYHLDWFLLGGEGDLFKYNTGAPFVPEPTTAALFTAAASVMLLTRCARRDGR